MDRAVQAGREMRRALTQALIEAAVAARKKTNRKTLAEAIASGDEDRAFAASGFEDWAREYEAALWTLHGLSEYADAAREKQGRAPVRPSVKLERWIDKNIATEVRRTKKDGRKIIREVIKAKLAGALDQDQARSIISNSVGLNSLQARAVRSKIARMAEDGVDIDEIEREASVYSDKLLNARAELIATEETQRAIAKAQELSWKVGRDDGEIGEDWLKHWLAADDACPVCLELDGQEVPLDEEFDSSAGSFKAPPEPHIGCKCVLTLIDPSEQHAEKHYDPDQARDDWGRWTDDGGPAGPTDSVEDAGGRPRAVLKDTGSEPTAVPRLTEDSWVALWSYHESRLADMKAYGFPDEGMKALRIEMGADFYAERAFRDPVWYERTLDNIANSWAHIGGAGPTDFRFAVALAFGTNGVAFDSKKDSIVSDPYDEGRVIEWAGALRREYEESQKELEAGIEVSERPSVSEWFESSNYSEWLWHQAEEGWADMDPSERADYVKDRDKWREWAEGNLAKVAEVGDVELPDEQTAWRNSFDFPADPLEKLGVLSDTGSVIDDKIKELDPDNTRGLHELVEQAKEQQLAMLGHMRKSSDLFQQRDELFKQAEEDIGLPHALWPTVKRTIYDKSGEERLNPDYDKVTEYIRQTGALAKAREQEKEAIETAKEEAFRLSRLTVQASGRFEDFASIEKSVLERQRDELVREYGKSAFAKEDPDNVLWDRFRDEFEPDTANEQEGFDEWAGDNTSDVHIDGDDWPVTLFRGVSAKVDSYVAGHAESWTSKEDVARNFGGSVMEKEVERERVLVFQGSKNWRAKTGGMGTTEYEFILLSQVPKWVRDARRLSERHALRQLRHVLSERHYDPDQPRDDRGRWTDGGGSGGSTGGDGKKLVTGPQRSANLKTWVGKSKLVDSGGRPTVAFHGTTHDIDTFDPSRGNVEGFLGSGVYLTSSADDAGLNYAGIGPDLESRIEQRQDQLEQVVADEPQFADASQDDIRAEARARAEKELVGSAGGNVMPLYVKMENPLVLGSDDDLRETYFETEYVYEDDDPDKDIIEEKGPLVDLMEAVMKHASQEAADKAVLALSEASGGEGLSASKVDAILRDALAYEEDEEGRLVSSQMIADIYKAIGFDGVVMDADSHFGTTRRSGRPMAGITPGTRHYIVWNPANVKSAIGNRGTFDPNNPSVVHEADGPSEFHYSDDQPRDANGRWTDGGVTVDDDVYGASHGQLDGKLTAKDANGSMIGYLNYALLEDRAHIQMVEATRRGAGAGKALVRALVAAVGGYENVDWGMMTPDGIRLRKRMDDFFDVERVVERVDTGSLIAKYDAKVLSESGRNLYAEFSDADKANAYADEAKAQGALWASVQEGVVDGDKRAWVEIETPEPREVVRKRVREKHYDPSQPRDEDGKWTDSGGGRLVIGEERTRNFKAWFGKSKVADESGKPMVVYHGTRSGTDFTEFWTDGPESDDEGNYSTSGSGDDPSAMLGAHFAEEPGVAGKFAMGSGASWLRSRFDEEGDAGPRVVPVYLKIENPAEFRSEGEFQDTLWSTPADVDSSLWDEYGDRNFGGDDAPDDFDERYQNDPDFTLEVNTELQSIARDLDNSSPEPSSWGMDLAREIAYEARRRMRAKGHDGIRYRNEVEGGWSWIAFDRGQIKSATANKGTFDAKSGDIRHMIEGRMSEELSLLRQIVSEWHFDPGQSRDDSGRWTSGAGSGVPGDMDEPEEVRQITTSLKQEKTAPPRSGKVFDPDVTEDADGDGITDAARVGIPAMEAPPPPRDYSIPRMPNLTEDERSVEESFARVFESDPAGMVGKYEAMLAGQEKTDKKITFGTDDVKALHEAWADPENRARYNVALHQTANAIAKRAFLNRLDQLKSGDKVLVTSGGCGAGKGYALKNVDEAKSLSSQVGAIWDSAGDQNATENAWIMKESEARGLRPVFAYVHTDPFDAWASEKKGVVFRANSPTDGRMVDADVFADSYVIGAKNFAAFEAKNRDKADFIYLENKTTPKLLPSFPSEALKVNRSKLREFAHKTVGERVSKLRPSVVRGALIGSRIWSNRNVRRTGAHAAREPKEQLAGPGNVRPGGSRTAHADPQGADGREPAEGSAARRERGAEGLAILLDAIREWHYSDDQKRDERGRWTDGGSQVSWEATPHPKTGFLPGIQSASYEERAAYLKDVQTAFAPHGKDVLAEAAGLSGRTFEAPGLYQGEFNPGVQVELTRGKDFDPAREAEAVHGYAAAVGFLLKQEAVAYHQPYHEPDESQHGGAEIGLGRTVSREEMTEVYEALKESLGADVDSIALVPSGNGLRVLNFTPVPNDKFHDTVVEAVAGRLQGEVGYNTFAFKGDLISNDWSKNTDGKGYTGDIRKGLPALRQEVGRVYKRLREVNRRYEAKFGKRERQAEEELIERLSDIWCVSEMFGEWDEKDHPRIPAGMPGGGRWAGAWDVVTNAVDVKIGKREFKASKIKIGDEESWLIVGRRGEYVGKKLGGSKALTVTDPRRPSRNPFPGLVLEEDDGKLIVRRHPGGSKAATEALQQLRRVLIELHYDPNQPRDDLGRWADDGGPSSSDEDSNGGRDGSTPNGGKPSAVRRERKEGETVPRLADESFAALQRYHDEQVMRVGEIVDTDEKVRALQKIDAEMGSEYWAEKAFRDDDWYNKTMDDVRGSWIHIGGDGPANFRFAVAAAFGIEGINFDAKTGEVRTETDVPGTVQQWAGCMRREYEDSQQELQDEISIGTGEPDMQEWLDSGEYDEWRNEYENDSWDNLSTRDKEALVEDKDGWVEWASDNIDAVEKEAGENAPSQEDAWFEYSSGEELFDNEWLARDADGNAVINETKLVLADDQDETRSALESVLESRAKINENGLKKDDIATRRSEIRHELEQKFGEHWRSWSGYVFDDKTGKYVEQEGSKEWKALTSELTNLEVQRNNLDDEARREIRAQASESLRALTAAGDLGDFESELDDKLVELRDEFIEEHGKAAYADADPDNEIRGRFFEDFEIDSYSEQSAFSDWAASNRRQEKIDPGDWPVTMYRGVKTDVDTYTPGYSESWSTSREVARQFGSNIMEVKVDRDKVLVFQGAKNWVAKEGGMGTTEYEFIILSQKPKWLKSTQKGAGQ